MSKQNDGGSAFPVVGMQQRANQEFLGVFQTGMTLRDYFAAKAMQGMCANGDADNYEDFEDMAGVAYQMADAMLTERQKHPPGEVGQESGG